MLWYYRQTGAIQSMPPWGGSFLHPEVQADLYPNWEKVADEFVPPIAEPAISPKSPAEQIQELNAEYTAYYNKLLQFYLAALVAGDVAVQNDIQVEIEFVKADYQVQLKTLGGE